MRKGHLDKVIPHLEEFLGKQGMDITCYVGHQKEDGKFHRSGTKNREYLEAKNFEISLAVDGEDGLDKFLNNSWDILLLDVMMPKKDGFL